MKGHLQANQMLKRRSRLSDENSSSQSSSPSEFGGLTTPIHRYAEPPAQLSAARVGHSLLSATIAQSKKGYLPGSFGL